MTNAVPFYADITDADIDRRGILWKETEARSKALGPGEVAGAGSSKHSSEAPAERFEDPAPDAHPAPGALTLSTYRDLWAGPITELNPPLRFLAPQQRAELSLVDAERLGLSSGDEVTVSQNGTSIRTRVAIRERVPEGTCLLIEGTKDGNANALLNGGPVSVQIEKDAAP